MNLVAPNRVIAVSQMGRSNYVFVIMLMLIALFSITILINKTIRKYICKQRQLQKELDCNLGKGSRIRFGRVKKGGKKS